MKYFLSFLLVFCLTYSLACLPANARCPRQVGACATPIASIPALPGDNADMAEAVARGFGNRIAIGPYREATLAVRAWRAGATPNDPDDLNARLGRTPRFTACQKATMAVMALEMVNSFSPGTIPPQVLAMAIQLQQVACGIPPTPTPVPKATAQATSTVIHRLLLPVRGRLFPNRRHLFTYRY